MVRQLVASDESSDVREETDEGNRPAPRLMTGYQLAQP
jgi:hypothetical protein